MKRMFISPVALSVLALAPAFAQRKATIQNVPEIPFTTVPNFLKLPPGEYLGEAVAVATNSKGHIFVFHRSNNNRLFEFDQTGKFIKEIGSGFLGFEFAHSVRIDKDDNIYVADSESGSVARTRTDWKRGIRIGRIRDGAVTAFIPDPTENPPSTSGAEGVAVDAAGNIYGAEVGSKSLKRYVRK